MAEPSPSEFRWQALLRRASEPLFLLNRHRRLLFANRAWESCTGLTVAAARGRPCRPARARDRESDETPLPTFAPPAEALAGQACRARRRALDPAAGWWQLDFFPLRGEDGLVAILGKITLLPASSAALPPLPDRLVALRDRHAAAFRLEALTSDLPTIDRVRTQADLASRGRMPVTLVGEAGTGKQWLARAIHQGSPHRDRCFACFDCRALPPLLLAELLLGPHGRRLALGTIYLREPAELPRDLQDRLARRLRAEPDADDEPRYIVGHRVDPAEAVRAGRLLAELHCALSPLTIVLPPLHERLADLGGLLATILERGRQLAEHAVTAVSPEAALALANHSWPGNLRELGALLHDAAARARGERIELADLPFYLRAGPMPAEKKLPLDELLEQAERRIILLALRQAHGNHKQAADILGIWRPRLLRRMQHLGIAKE
jgi:transcriptional regulator with PAS, ATPase and Fis domain